MKSFEHIEKMETIMNSHEDIIKKLDDDLDFIENHQEDYNSLIEYYFSEQRNQDLEDDKNGIIPKTMSRGVLSEDLIYDLMSDYYDLGIRMLEVSAKILKR